MSFARSIILLLLSTLTVYNSEILNDQSCDRSDSFKMNPLKIGVEIEDRINLCEYADDVAFFDRVKKEVYRHRLVVFRDQGEIPAERLIAIGEHFGSVFYEAFTTQTKNLTNHRKAPSSAIMRISNDVNEGFKGVGVSGWHMDGAYKDTPYSFLIFNAVRAPMSGDTKFVGFRELLQSLDESTVAKWDLLSSVNTRTVRGEKVYQIHPLTYSHPTIDETVMCLHLGYMKGAIMHYGAPNERRLSDAETEALRAEITQEIIKDSERLVYSHKWRDGDVIIIDNLQLAHLASKESQMSVDKVGLRILHRVAINGVQRPLKRG